MNFYPHHIGDFNSATRHLTRIERSIYRDLLDIYYDTERALNLDTEHLCRLVIARSDEERTAVQQVLNEFFTETEHGWVHDRCEAEIAKYKGIKEAKSAAGKASAAARAAKQTPDLETPATDVEHVLNGCSTNQEPLTITQEQEQKSKALVPSGDATAGYSAEFEACWAKYPKRAGGNSKKAAHKAWSARIREGVTAEALEKAVHAYAAEMIAKGKVGTEYVKQAATFFGPNEHWLEATRPGNVHPIRKGLGHDGKLLPGYFWHADDFDLPVEKRRILSHETHDVASGYSWAYLRSKGRA